MKFDVTLQLAIHKVKVKIAQRDGFATAVKQDNDIRQAMRGAGSRRTNFQTLTRVSNNFARTRVLRISISRA